MSVLYQHVGETIEAGVLNRSVVRSGPVIVMTKNELRKIRIWTTPVPEISRQKVGSAFKLIDEVDVFLEQEKGSDKLCDH